MNLEKLINPGIQDIKPYVPGKSVAAAMRDYGITDFVKMASNENPLGMNPQARQVILKNLAKASQYPEVQYHELNAAMAKKTGLKAENLIFGNGADGIIYPLGMTLINQDDEIIIPQLTFPIYESISRIMRGKIIFSRMLNFDIDLNDILNKITDKTKMIWLANPNNPTGSMIENRVFMDFYKSVPPHVFVVHDEVYADFTEKKLFPRTKELIKEKNENLFIIRSFSKIYGLAGLRIGFGAGTPRLIRLMYNVRLPFDVSVPAQLAAAAALADDDFYNKTINFNNKEKEYLYKQLNALSFKYIPTHTNFILINVKQDCKKIFQALQKEGVIIRPMASYNLPTYIRVTIGTHQQNQRFINALKRVV